QFESLFTHLKRDSAFHHVEPLLLRKVHMQGRTAGAEILMLDQKEAAYGFVRGYLKKHGAEAHRDRASEAILSRADDVQLICRRRRRLGARILSEHIVQTCTGN